MALRSWLFLEALIFLLAAQIHLGRYLSGYDHARSAAMEAVISLVLLIVLTTSYVAPEKTRGLSLAAQAFGIFLMVVSLILLAMGKGPETGPDLVFHVFALMLLACGWLTAYRRSPIPDGHLIQFDDRKKPVL